MNEPLVTLIGPPESVAAAGGAKRSAFAVSPGFATVAAMRRTLFVAGPVESVAYSVVARGRSAPEPVCARCVLPLVAAARILPDAHGMMLTLVDPAAPPPPTRGMVLPAMICATPFAAGAPRLVPRAKSVERFNRLIEAKLRLSCWAAFGVSVTTLFPLVRFRAPALSAVAAAALPVIVRVAPREVIAAVSLRRLLLFAVALSIATVPAKS